MKRAYSYIFAGFLTIALTFLMSNDAHAQITLSQIFFNIGDSFNGLPALLSALGYLLGSLYAALGVLDLKKSVEDNGQTPMRKGWGKLIIGGMLATLPMVYEAIQNAFTGGNADSASGANADAVTGLRSRLGLDQGTLGEGVINDLFQQIVDQSGGITGLITLLSILFALIIAFTAILKLREHIDNPDQVPMKEPVIRLLIAGALFAMPTLVTAASNMITGGADFGGGGQIATSTMQSPDTEGGAGGGQCDGGDSTELGGVICRLASSTNYFPALLAFCAYIFGTILIVWSIFKIKDHAMNPGQTSLFEGLSRMIAGGAFMALPIVVYAIRNSLTNDGSSRGGSKVTGYNDGGLGGNCDDGLDSIISCFMTSIYGPMNVAVILFSVMAGTVFIMIGISRLTKSAQEGAKGPGGIGTLMTFLTGAALLSSNGLVRIFSNSTFSNPVATTNASLIYTDGMSQAEQDHVHTIIAAIFKFLVVIGFISFVRGIFILRGVAEGNQQSSFMAATTHMIGGALAVNLGPLLDVIQTTLGIADYGMRFS